MKRPPHSCVVNNYNPTILKAWQANIDLQLVHNYYKAVSYMCAYFSKSESESSSALKQASQEIKDQKGVKQAMYKIVSAFSCSRQVSVQEAAYLSLPELWLRKCFPKTVYVNSGLPSDRIRIYKSEEEIKELSSDSTDVFKRSLCDRYIGRPNATFCKGRYAQVDSICLVLFPHTTMLITKLTKMIHNRTFLLIMLVNITMTVMHCFHLKSHSCHRKTQ